MLVIDYPENCGTINSQYYCNVLDQLNKNIGGKKSGIVNKKIIILQDNAPAHENVLTRAELNELKYVHRLIRFYFL